MTDLKVSILVPVYGVEAFIRQCAVSLFAQTYGNIEYVFVDDCTPDNSIAILQDVLRSYPNRREQVKIVCHQANRGLGAGRKTALAASSGEFVLNVDSDDYLLPDAVETLVKVQQVTGADIVTGNHLALYPDGRMVEKHCQKLDKSKTLKLLLIQNTLLYNIWARLIRRSVYDDYGIDAVEGVNMAEDYGLVPRLIFAAGQIAYADKGVYVYRMTSASSTFSKPNQQHIVSILKANEVVRQYIQSNDYRQEYTFALEIGMLNVWYLALKAGQKPSQIREICHYTPQILMFRLCHLLFAHRSVLPLLRFSYLTIKWCYKRCLHYSL